MREIQWLKRIMSELGDDRESTKECVAGNQHEAAHSAVDEDDSELVLLLRAKADPTGCARGVQAAEPEEDEGDYELDQLLQRALMLLRQRDEQGSKVTKAEATSEQDDDDDELDRLLRRAMLLFVERRRLSVPYSAVTGAVEASAKVASTPGSPSMTDGEDDGEDDEEDDELEALLRREMGLLGRRSRVLASNQEPDGELDASTPLAKAATPMDWRKVLCLQQLDKLQRKQTKKNVSAHKRQRDEKQ
ncbi:hypothetical protein PHYSODRAFT_258325 [Phytophthora sojae]|uniref:Uncharacterized protein n=1 Tax=Phytophthora sojae (strain P6497) TaxID=1094619 RepID=G5ABX8_PHYSP|nr:hypothetical protein PHYSODRAFT_258325 [Phytophthora sojae]EGZ06853.1 hypothetical protein PHYSODRAFT_258325 [Phytophthora sojae]|eukprot:XP_009537617.1 hypothetical protein PHYSODRAFT_258325 [Phytophthora sojae]